MKTKLEEAREMINEVDEQMISLFIKRMAAVSMVAEYKMENNLPVLDSIREDVIKGKNFEILSNKMLEKYYNTFFDGVLKASKDYQTDLVKMYEEKK
ncbi:MAG: chorismate mutase [Acholeplasmatales bacterium]|nr:chorismate mutase [Acholeplasmatales bacterium]